MKKVAVVTGASSGIGEATVKKFLAEGYEVYAAARRLDRMAGLADLGAKLVSLDLTDDPSIVAAAERIRAEAGRIDVLVNNAGYGSYGAIEDVPLDEARRQFEVNLFGAARLIQLALPMMRAAKRQDRQYHLDRRQGLGAVRGLVSLDQIRPRRLERLFARRAAPFWHRRDRHRAGRHQDGMDRDRLG